MKRKTRWNVMMLGGTGVLLLVGCGSPKAALTSENVAVELGTELDSNIADYVTFGENVTEEKKEAALEKMSLDVSKVDVHAIGEYEAQIQYGNTKLPFTVRVEDMVAPTASLKREKLDVVTGEEIVAADLVTDIQDEQEVTVQFVQDGKMTDTCTFGEAGASELTIRLTDASGNTSELTQAVNVTLPDATAPVIQGVKNKTIYLGGTVDYKKGVTATDDVDGDVTDRLEIDSTSVNTKKEGTYTVTYTVKDAAGNEADAVMKVTVKKKEAPKQQEVQQSVPVESKSASTDSDHSSDSSSGDSHSSQDNAGEETATVSESAGTPESSQPESAGTESTASSSNESASTGDTGTSGGTPCGVRTEHGTLFGGLPQY